MIPSRVVSERGFYGVSALLFATSAAVTIAWCTSMSAMGGMSMPGGWTMSMMWMRMPGQTWLGSAASFVGMWTVMMIAMMLPVFVPMLRRYRAAIGPTSAAPLGWLSARVGLAYLFVWTVPGIIVFALGIGLAELAMQHALLSRAVPVAVGASVLIAGLWQLTESKARSLACCRDVRMCVDLARADGGAAWKYGIDLGLRCARCCSNLMAMVVIIGVMDVVLMAIVTAAIAAERLLPAGARIAQATGVLVIAAGLVLTARAIGLG